LRGDFIYGIAMDSSTVLHFLIAYVGAILFTALSNWHEFRKHPDKACRYKALPLAYKVTCWLGVLPLMAATTAHGAFGIAGFLVFFLLEAACVRWYRKAGLY
jgi:hypothetical protein